MTQYVSYCDSVFHKPLHEFVKAFSVDINITLMKVISIYKLAYGKQLDSGDKDSGLILQKCVEATPSMKDKPLHPIPCIPYIY